MTTTLHATCCDKGKKFLPYILKESCAFLDIDPHVSGFYMDVSGTYPDSAWERILFCPFCGKGLVSLVEDGEDVVIHDY